MSLIKPILIVSGVGLIAYAGYSYYTIQTELLTNSNYQISDIRLGVVTLKTLQLNIDVQFDNNSNINVTVQQLYLDIFLNGQNVGNVQQVIQSPILPKSSTTIPLIANVSLSTSFDTLKDSIGSALGLNSGSKLVAIKASGNAYIKSGLVSTSVPLSFEKDFKI
jgi:LEA14-like dessication related protein